jgi:hypothetical protein
MLIGNDTLYGNEWINYDQTYYKIMVAQDGIYRIPQSALPADMSGVEANRFQLYYFGEEIPIYTTTDGVMGAGDYIEFYGVKNRGEMDRFLYADWEDQFNPYYSLFSDSSAYFLTWTDTVSTLHLSEVQNDLSNLPEKEKYYWAQSLIHSTVSNDYYKNVELITPAGNNPIPLSHFLDGEGWGRTDGIFNISVSHLFSNTTENARLTLQFANRYYTPNALTVKVPAAGAEESFSFSRYEAAKAEFDIPVQVIGSTLNVQITGSNRLTSYLSLEYPRAFNADSSSQFVFGVKGGPGKKYLEIEHFKSDGLQPILFDLTNRIWINCNVDGGIVRVVLPESTEDRKLVLMKPGVATTLSGVFFPISFTDFSEKDPEFLIIYHQAMAAGPTNWVKEYAAYRNDSPYNPFDTLTLEIQQVYDQFGYGIPRHPMAIRNLIHAGLEEWSNLQYAFLIGKGREYHNIRNASTPPSFFIPTFGYPGADNLFAAPIGESYPSIPIGRLPATLPTDVKAYLEKVMEYEAASDPNTVDQTIAGKEWMKRILHLGGGNGNAEITQIKNYLAAMEQKIETNRFGGEVTTFIKTTSEPVQTSSTEGIINRINNGIALLTFFGHSSATVLDFNFDDPGSYENKGKYPIFLAFGCNSGNMFNASQGVGERFLKAEQKGIVGFISNTGYGFTSSLNNFGNAFYGSLGGNQYGSSIGNILRSTNPSLDAPGNFFGDRALGQQISIQGDPSLKIYFSEKPDYLPNPATVEIEPRILNTLVDSFTLKLDIHNIGQHIQDTAFTIQIRHELPNGEMQDLKTDTIHAPAFRSPYSVRLPLLGEELVGMNRLFLTIDADNQIDELDEVNNILKGPDELPGIPFYINSFEAIPLYPANFSIANQPNVTLKASTGNTFDPSNLYRMEIDTTMHFDSPLKQSTEITQVGGVLHWTPAISWIPHTVYYWRISPDKLPEQPDYSWRSSSFVYLPDSSPGWNQSHFFQFEGDVFVDMEFDTISRKLKFITDFVDIKIRNNAWDVGYDPRYLRGNRNNLVDDSWARYKSQIANTVPSGIYFSVLHPISVNAIPITGSGANSAPDNKGFFFKTTTPSERNAVKTFIEDKIPDSTYVVVFTLQNSPSADYKPYDWDNDPVSLFDVLEAQGAKQIRSLDSIGSRPYCLFFQKGVNSPSNLADDIIGNFGEITDLSIPVPGAWTEGSLTSPPIGPATKWETLDWSLSGIESTDEVKLSVWGIRASGQDTLLYDNVLNAVNPLPLENIDATQIPYLKLHYFAKDPTQKTPPHLEYWRIHYQGVPEAALDPAGHFALQSDTLLQGAPLLLEVSTENLSDYNMDSLLVRYTILNAQNQATNIEHRYRPLPARDTLIAHLQYDTRPSVGVHQLTIDVNPDDDQPEQTHINNVGILQFYVEKDLRNPLLDVTFDGEHILDGDLVSATPQIQVQLKDENPFLALEDTSLFRLLLVHPDGLEERLYFTDERIRFYPADMQNGKNNRARVEFNPVFTTDGEYAFYVEAKDVTGNKTGDIDHVVSLSTFGYDYKVSFKVFTESMISNVLNYPNPFSTSTRFLYTLTGSEPPAWFTIQILTVSGRVVREITQHEIGPMKIGTHLTDYAWDGRDEFGDPLANGVYLYRVVAKKANGENFKAFASGADSFFEKGYGKMVIIR